MTDGSAEMSTPRVFAIEDNPADIRLVKEGVDATGIDLDLEVINSGRQAIERLTALGPRSQEAYLDLVLLDLNLPGKSGFDVLDAIRTETPLQNVPVVVVSSSENKEDIRRVYESSANAYVTKPADPDDYIRMIETAIDFWITNVTQSPKDE